jgi:hypothetical protein
MSIADNFNIELANIPCLRNLSEDELRELVNALKVVAASADLEKFVTSTGGIIVKFEFGPDGNFAGVTAKIGGQAINLIGGAGANELQLFAGAPTATNPGPGWEPDVEATQALLNQGSDQTTWDYFYARRVSVLATGAA